MEGVACIKARSFRSGTHSSSPRTEVGTEIGLVAASEAMAAAAAAASLQTAWCNSKYTVLMIGSGSGMRGELCAAWAASSPEEVGSGGIIWLTGKRIQRPMQCFRVFKVGLPARGQARCKPRARGGSSAPQLVPALRH